jgi:hypothetical protein
MPGFAISESPTYVARGVAALAQDSEHSRWADTIISARQLADAYGVTDTDGSKPDCWGYLAAYGWEREDGEGIEDFSVNSRLGRFPTRPNLSLCVEEDHSVCHRNAIVDQLDGLIPTLKVAHLSAYRGDLQLLMGQGKSLRR